jgi:hypothetical protein
MNRSRVTVNWIRKVVRWSLGPSVVRVPRFWLHCPICDRELVGPYAPGMIVPQPAGPIFEPPSRAELIAKCPVHGHRPFNDPDPRPRYTYKPKD